MLFKGLILDKGDGQFLENFVRLNNRPHALLLDTSQSGLQGAVVERLANFLLCLNPQAAEPCGQCSACKTFKLDGHPDFLPVRVDEGKNIIRIEQVKELISKLAYAPSISKLHVCVIYDLHLLNEAAANALLKVLEEPPGECLFLFLTDNPENILPTILSRLIVHRLHAVDLQSLQKLLPEGFPPAEGLALCRLSGGHLGKLERFVQDDSRRLRELGYRFVKAWGAGNLLDESLQPGWQLAGQRENLEEFIFYLANYVQDLLFIDRGCQSLIRNTDCEQDLLGMKIPSEDLEYIQELLSANDAWHQLNISGKLIIDNLFVQFM